MLSPVGSGQWSVNVVTQGGGRTTNSLKGHKELDRSPSRHWPLVTGHWHYTVISIIQYKLATNN